MSYASDQRKAERRLALHLARTRKHAPLNVAELRAAALRQLTPAAVEVEAPKKNDDEPV